MEDKAASVLAKTAVVLELPSQKGCICHIPEVNFAICFIDSAVEGPEYEKFFSWLKS